MTDELTVQRRLTSVAYALQHAHAVGLACPFCTLKIAKVIDEFLVTGDVAEHPAHTEPDVEVSGAANVVPFDPSKKH